MTPYTEIILKDYIICEKMYDLYSTHIKFHAVLEAPSGHRTHYCYIRGTSQVARALRGTEIQT